MPDVFLSYAHDDSKTVAEIETALKTRGCNVWSHQQSLYGSQSWAKAIGEAILASDGIVLFWSKNASRSYYVEFEWNTALALKKPVIPYVLDDTPLPPPLHAINAIPGTTTEEDIPKILSALATGRDSTPLNPDNAAIVMDRLGKLKEPSSPEKAIEHVKALQQKIENVHGNVIQAGGNVTINQPPVAAEKSKAKKLALWLTIVTAILAIATFILDLPEKLSKNWLPDSARYYGRVVYAEGDGVAEADIFVLEKVGGDTLGVGRTLESGDFNFIVKAKHESSVYVRVLKDGHAGFSAYKVLTAGDKIPFE